MGVVIDVNQKTNMMLVNFPKKSQSKWIPWNNLGHYIVISWAHYLHFLKGTIMRLLFLLLLTCCDYPAVGHDSADSAEPIRETNYVDLHHKICTIENFDTISSDAMFEELLDDCLNDTSKSLNLYAF